MQASTKEQSLSLNENGKGRTKHQTQQEPKLTLLVHSEATSFEVAPMSRGIVQSGVAQIVAKTQIKKVHSLHLSSSYVAWSSYPNLAAMFHHVVVPDDEHDRHPC